MRKPRRKIQLVCFCGREYEALAYNVKSGHTKSCGCLRVRFSKAAFTKHGQARRGQRTSEYTIWKGMRQRCFEPTNPAYKYYGARGITICERWNDFRNFLADMGRRPAKNYSIERINNDGNYEPSNCKWIPRSDQSKNRRGVGTGFCLRGHFKEGKLACPECKRIAQRKAWKENPKIRESHLIRQRIRRARNANR